eukprot:363758-Chlamydomonas_euryale.AAC.4
MGGVGGVGGMGDVDSGSAGDVGDMAWFVVMWVAGVGWAEKGRGWIRQESVLIHGGEEVWRGLQPVPPPPLEKRHLQAGQFWVQGPLNGAPGDGTSLGSVNGAGVQAHSPSRTQTYTDGENFQGGRSWLIGTDRGAELEQQVWMLELAPCPPSFPPNEAFLQRGIGATMWTMLEPSPPQHDVGAQRGRGAWQRGPPPGVSGFRGQAPGRTASHALARRGHAGLGFRAPGRTASHALARRGHAGLRRRHDVGQQRPQLRDPGQQAALVTQRAAAVHQRLQPTATSTSAGTATGTAAGTDRLQQRHQRRQRCARLAPPPAPLVPLPLPPPAPALVPLPLPPPAPAPVPLPVPPPAPARTVISGSAPSADAATVPSEPQLSRTHSASRGAGHSRGAAGTDRSTSAAAAAFGAASAAHRGHENSRTWRWRSAASAGAADAAAAAGGGDAATHATCVTATPAQRACAKPSGKVSYVGK